MAKLGFPSDGAIISVRIAFDSEAKVWFVASSDNMLGLAAEAPTAEALVARIPDMIEDLIEDNVCDVEVFADTIADYRYWCIECGVESERSG